MTAFAPPTRRWGDEPVRSWSSVLSVQLMARVEVVRALAAALADLHTATAAHEDLEESLVGALVSVLGELEAVQVSAEVALDSLVTRRARPPQQEDR